MNFQIESHISMSAVLDKHYLQIRRYHIVNIGQEQQGKKHNNTHRKQYPNNKCVA